ncbi:MAG TPA: carbohydrate kinase family protein [Gemmatimonadales bacterium]
MPRLGVVGVLVWDEIHGRDPAAPAVEEWGGIAYALAALDAALPSGWDLVPLIKVGRDMSAAAAAFYRSLRRLAPGARPIEVDAANNRVVLHYQTSARRCERMSGGVPAWTWPELGPLVHDLDALYVNFISGYEMTLETARALRQAFPGPIYADLHSLFLGKLPDGTRVLQALPDAAAWFGCFDTVQMNEEELDQMGGEPMPVAATVLAAGAGALVVTVGARGAVYFETGGRADGRTGGPVRTALVPAPSVEALDPTGCGDVFGATCCARMLAGDGLESAVAAANAAAARNATYRGATGLAGFLRGELVGASCA